MSSPTGTVAMNDDADPNNDVIRNEIASVNERFAEALRLRQPERLSDLFTADIELLPPGMALISGRSAVTAFWARTVSNPAVTVDSHLESTEILVLGDIAIEQGKSKLTIRAGVEAPTKQTGKYLVVWRRDDGKWRMYRDIFNNDETTNPEEQ